MAPLRSSLPSLASLQAWLAGTPPLVLAMAVLSAGLIGASAVAVKGLRSATNAITVTGASTERIRSDFVDWSVEVKQSAASQPLAYQQIQPAVQQTIAFLKARGIPDAEWQLEAVKSEREDIRDPRTGELRATIWTARQTIQIRSAAVDRIATISREIGALIGQGVPLTINTPAFTYTQLAQKRVDMLAKATRDARRRAQAIAAEAGASVGPVTKVDTGIFQITAPNSTETSDSGSYDTRTIDKDITAVMAVTFRVN